MFFDQFPYVAVPTLTGHMEADVQNLLEAVCLTFMDYTIASGRLLCLHTNWTLAYDWLTGRA